MTHDQAITKWCPFARLMWPATSAGNCSRDERNPEECRCIGRDCAVWTGYSCGMVVNGSQVETIVGGI